ncbi:DUF5361 domain-containing protein [uncultured Dubosiella sp.]|nr:DUF5361 domain-containing protein [uncultured Dubosiella sp.]
MCDLAQTYRIYDMRAFPPRTIAIFANGLGDESRIKMKLSKSKVSLTKMILAAILDDLNVLIWTRAKEGTPKPRSLVEALSGVSPEPGHIDRLTPEEFEKRRYEIIGEEGDHG